MAKVVLENGYLNVGQLKGVPIRFHWSTALGALFFGGFAFRPAFWLAFVVLVLVHELGHALLVQRLGHRALSIEVTGFGGLCRWDGGRATELHRTLIAWGGVLAQAVLLVAAYAYLALLGPVTNIHEAQILSAFTRTNLWLIGLNLLPIPPLDGAQAWRILKFVRL